MKQTRKILIERFTEGIEQTLGPYFTKRPDGTPAEEFGYLRRHKEGGWPEVSEDYSEATWIAAWEVRDGKAYRSTTQADISLRIGKPGYPSLVWQVNGREKSDFTEVLSALNETLQTVPKREYEG